MQNDVACSLLRSALPLQSLYKVSLGGAAVSHLIIGCGYLGRRVARLWLDQGHTVHAATRKSENAEPFRAMGLQPVVCDVLQPEALTELPPHETILYAVGLDRGGGASMQEVYVEGLRRTLSVLAPPKKLIYVSSTSVYGQT